MRNRYFLVTSFPGQRRDWRRVEVGGCLSLFFQGNGHFQGLLGLLRGLSFCPFFTASGSFLHGLSGPSLPVSAAFLHVMASGAFLHGLQGLFPAIFPRISSRPLGSAPGGDYFFSAFLSAA